MRKLGKYLFVLSTLFPLCSCSFPEKEIKKEKAMVEDEYQSVCISGNREVPTEAGANLLPTGYWGNYPDAGIVEIGGKAGDENGKRLSPIDMKLEKQTFFSLTVSFDGDPMYFPSNTLLNQLGYEFSYIDEYNKEQSKTCLYEASQFSSLFHDYEPNYAQGPDDERLIRTTFYVYHPQNAIGMNFYLKKGQKLNYVKIYYGDRPQNILNVALFQQYWNMDKAISQLYQGVDCSKKDYLKNVGSFPVYHMYSNYGTIYSKNFLLSSFLARDEEDQSEFHITEVEDEDGYFLVGDKAPIGSKFTVRLLARDNNFNTSMVTFYFTVADLRAPLIVPKQEEIDVSYTKTNQEIIEEYFYISDNVDKELDNKIRLSNGSLLPSKQIGDFDCVLTSKDQNQNESKYEFTLHVKDDIPPVIKNDFDELNLSVSQAYTTTQLKELFTAEDEIDGKCEVSIMENTYSSHAREVGSYYITIEAKDKSSNTTTKTIQIHVSDENGPVFFVKESFLSFAQGKAPTKEEIIASLIRQEVLPDKKYQDMVLVSGTEIFSELEEGTYEATYQFIAVDESEEFIDISFEVLPQNDTTDSEVEEKGFWQMIADFFIRIWEGIVSFFTGK